MQYLRLQQEVLWSSIIVNGLSGRSEERDWRGPLFLFELSLINVILIYIPHILHSFLWLI